MSRFVLLTVNVIVAVIIPRSTQCPHDQNAKAAYKTGEIEDQSTPITLDKIKTKLRENGVFNSEDRSLTDREQKELAKLFDAVEIMVASRDRQPQSVQNLFTSLRIVERAVKRQLKEGQISDTLAAKFHWDNITRRLKRSKPAYKLNSTKNMRIFNLDPQWI